MSKNNHEQDIKDRLRLAVKVTIAIITVAVLSMCQIMVLTAIKNKNTWADEKTGITTIDTAAFLNDNNNRSNTVSRLHQRP